MTNNLSKMITSTAPIPEGAGNTSREGYSIPPLVTEDGSASSAPDATTPPDLGKKIGKTTYRVKVHFSTTSKETMCDKIKRMLRNEISQM